MTAIDHASCASASNQDPIWLLDGDAAREAARLVRLVAERLTDPDDIARIVDRPGNAAPADGLPMWGPATLSHGLPGTAVFYAELGRIDPAWLEHAHRHLTAAAAAVPTAPSAGLFAGPASLLAAAQSCAGSEGHYRGLRRKLVLWLAADHARRLAMARARPGPGVAWMDYDVIHGLSGTTRLLLDAMRDPDDEMAATSTDAVTDTLRHLVRLTEPIIVDGHEIPGWWVPPHLEPVEQDRRDYPRGDLNLGLAHGAAGPLSVLATAVRYGVEVSGQREAVVRLAQWLLDWRMTDDVGVYWPCRVSLDEQIAAASSTTFFTRTAWCYGAPGVCAALHQAGLALGVPEWCDVAVGALLDGLRRDRAAWHVDGPTICHGYAGLLQVLCRVGVESGDRRLFDGCREVARMVLDEADQSVPFVFPHLVPDSPDGWRNATGYLPLDGVGLLEGAAGVACALLSVIPPRLLGGTDSAVGRADLPPWDRCLALC